jgi:hypothetical protein
MNHRMKVALFTLAISALAIANMTIHTGKRALSDLSSRLQPNEATCKSLPAATNSKEALGKLLNQELKARDIINCSNGWFYTSAGQNWCEHLANECDDGFPWHENFEKERTRYWYKCPGLPPVDVFSCSSWINSGCCGSSDPSEPTCPGVSGRTCIPGTEPAPG